MLLNPYRSDLRVRSDVDVHPAATFDQSLLAMTIDLLFLALLMRAITAVVGSGDITQTMSTLLLWFSYFVATQWWFGFTVGKFLLGIRLQFYKPRSWQSLGGVMLR